jgi:hypothetical protein
MSDSGSVLMREGFDDYVRGLEYHGAKNKPEKECSGDEVQCRDFEFECGHVVWLVTVDGIGNTEMRLSDSVRLVILNGAKRSEVEDAPWRESRGM